MIVWAEQIEDRTLENTDFRRVVATGRYSQLTFMCLKPEEDMGKEIHLGLDEFISVCAGHARLDVGPSEGEVEESHELEPGWTALVPGGYWFNIINRGTEDLRLWMLTAPPAHRRDVIYATRHESEMGEEREEQQEKLVRGYAEAEGFGA